MLGTNDNQTDMDITVILPEITFKDGKCKLDEDSPIGDLCENLHDPILSACCTNSLLRQLDGAYSVGDPERSGLRLIRHTIGGIKGVNILNIMYLMFVTNLDVKFVRRH
jgi:hypothetical protein